MPSNLELPLSLYTAIDTHAPNQILSALAFKKEAIKDYKLLNHSIYLTPDSYRWSGPIEGLKKIYRSFRYFDPVDNISEDIQGLISDIDAVFAPIYLNFSDHII